MSDPLLRIQRSQLAKFIGDDPAAIRAFEELFKQADSFSSGGVTEAPQDGTPYSREDAGWVGAPEKADVTANTAHSTGDGSDHANVALNDTHRASDGKDHSDVVLNNTHRGSDGKDHSDVNLNTTHRGSDGKDHSDVVLNNTHRGSDGKNHSDVVLNNAHRVSDGKNHSDVVLNNAHRVSDGKNHSDVVLNNTHRGSTGADHTWLNQSLLTTASPSFAGGSFTTAPTLGLARLATGDWNSYTTTGFYRGNNLTNTPTAGWYYVIVQQHSTTYVTQLALGLTGAGTNAMYHRIKSNGTWYAWRKVAVEDLTTGDLKITGSFFSNGSLIIDYASGANGAYVKLLMGTEKVLICWRGVSMSYSATNVWTSGTLTWPAAFNATPVALMSCSQVSSRYADLQSYDSLSSTQYSLRVHLHASVSSSGTCYAYAIGTYA
jgi:hypothetical protein